MSLNKKVGSVTKGLIFATLVGIGHKLYGNSIFNPAALAVLGAVSYVATGGLLRSIGFWRY